MMKNSKVPAQLILILWSSDYDGCLTVETAIFLLNIIFDRNVNVYIKQELLQAPVLNRISCLSMLLFAPTGYSCCRVCEYSRTSPDS